MSRPFLGVFFVILFMLTGFFCAISPLSAQIQEPQDQATPEIAASAVDESSIIIGESPVVPVPEAGSSVFVLIRMVLVLALAALAIYGVVFFIKRIAHPRETRDPHLKLLARLPLSNDSYAAVLSVGAKAWLVGGGSGGVSLISEIDDNESLETMLLDDARRSAETETRRFMDFRSLLSKMGASRERKLNREISGSHAENDSLADNGSLAESLRQQRERLRGL